MSLTIDGPRLLLRRLRRVMAQGGDWQKRLNAIVQLIADSMHTAVCSVYLMRATPAGPELELCATKGLNTAAVHKTRLRFGEGLVGDIAQHARPLNLAQAQAHPSFMLRPETDETQYQAFAGVPILSGGVVTGVLVVQNSVARAFADDELEVLQTVAMVLAEMLAGVILDKHHSLVAHVPSEFEGLSLVDGLVIGEVVLHEPHIEIGHMIASDTESELQRLDAGVYELRRNMDALLETASAQWGETLDIMETYRMFANDSGWLARMRDAVRTGLTAEAAVGRVLGDMRARLGDQRDHYLRDRLHDLEDLSNRLLSIITQAGLQKKSPLPKNAVLVARLLGPTELLEYRDAGLAAVVLEEGSPHAHITIVARALGLTMVGRVTRFLEHARMGQGIIVDGQQGRVYLEPSADVITRYQQQAKIRQREQKHFARIRQLPSRTKDGTDITLNINGGLLVDVQNISQSGAQGVGLFRTELQFLIAARMPRLAEQVAFYRAVLDAAGDYPLTFRTLDIGGDKVAPYMRATQEPNPAMGWRALRVAIDRPGFLRYQARALLQAAAGRDLRLMFPLVSTLGELRTARALVLKEYERLARFKYPQPRSLAIGTMLEVPALVWQLDDVLPEVDFLSVGSNDLLQFMFASDRSNARVHNRYDIISPAALSMLSYVIETCTRHDTPLSVCGESAGQPLEALILIGLGVRNLSMPRAAIGPVKRMVRSLHLARFAEQLSKIRTTPSLSRETLRQDLRALAHNQGVKL